MPWEVELARWLSWKGLQPTDRKELLDAQTNETEEELENRFSGDLTFGTGGLRGLLGIGTNRMNCYTVSKATRGLAAYLKAECEQDETLTCAIAYDSRIHSKEFAQVTACTLAEAGIRSYLYSIPMPTPMLSFAVRYLNCCCGVVITASHNPASYNGYKVYGADGCQITLEAAQKIQNYITKQPVLRPYTTDIQGPLTCGYIRFIPDEVCTAYGVAIEQCILRRPTVPLRVVYSPLNGTGGVPVRLALEQLGNITVSVVSVQEFPDGRFLTCPYPNPEEPQTMEMAACKARVEGADIFLATDPDCDRVGVGEVQNGNTKFFTGNEIGILLLDYICRTRLELGTMPARPVAVTTIVTTPLADAVAQKYGVELRRVLTGFKYIGEQIGQLEAINEKERFVFGFEESCGYLSGPYVRDKDGVNAVTLICEMASYYKAQSKTLSDALDALTTEYGKCKTALRSYTFTRAEASEHVMETIRQNPPFMLGKMHVNKVIDYYQDTGLPKSNVLKLTFSENASLLLRPSGTEPKLKLYLFVWGKASDDVDEDFYDLLQASENWLNNSSL